VPYSKSSRYLVRSTSAYEITQKKQTKEIYAMAVITPELITSLGIVCAIGCSSCGSCTATFISGTYLSRYSPTLSKKNKKFDWLKPFIPIVISGVLAIYGFIIALLLCFQFPSITGTDTDLATSYKYLTAGLSVGLTCLYSGGSMSNFLQDFINVHSQPLMNNCTITNSSTGIAVSACDANDSSTTVRPDSMTDPLLPSALRCAGNKGVPRPATDNSLPEPTIQFFMVLVFIEAIGLYGFIIALVLIFM
jgi:F0F1-type ATP synthase membrane subunit c/vacuolar-type H+-ATPase subunit K